MAYKIILAGIVGGIISFATSFLCEKLPGGEPKDLPGAKVLVPAMQANIPRAGFYFFPPLGIKAGMTNEQEKAAWDKLIADFKAGPTGILVYHPGGEDFNFGKHLSVQFTINFFTALLVSAVFAMTVNATNYGKRVLIALIIGVVAAVYVDLPYWNWYGFPIDYIIARVVGDAVTWFITGLAMAAIVTRPRAAQIA